LSCQGARTHLEHPKVLTRSQEGLFDCEQTSCAQSVPRSKERGFQTLRHK